MGRKGIGIELKPSYYKQAVRNLNAAPEYIDNEAKQDVKTIYDFTDPDITEEPTEATA